MCKDDSDTPTTCCEEESYTTSAHHNGLLKELGVVWLLPVEQVLEIVDEGSLPQVTSLGQNWTHKQRFSKIIHVKEQNWI